jgi:hypothetical protein
MLRTAVPCTAGQLTPEHLHCNEHSSRFLMRVTACVVAAATPKWPLAQIEHSAWLHCCCSHSWPRTPCFPCGCGAPACPGQSRTCPALTCSKSIGCERPSRPPIHGLHPKLPLSGGAHARHCHDRCATKLSKPPLPLRNPALFVYVASPTIIQNCLEHKIQSLKNRVSRRGVFGSRHKSWGALSAIQLETA